MKNRHIDQWDRTKNPDIKTQILLNDFGHRYKDNSGRKGNLVNKVCGSVGYQQALKQASTYLKPKQNELQTDHGPKHKKNNSRTLGRTHTRTNWYRIASKLKAFVLQRTRHRRTNSDGEKIFANYNSDKGAISRPCKELSKFNNKKTNDPTEEEAKDFNGHFSKEDPQTPRHIYQHSAEMTGKTLNAKMQRSWNPTEMQLFWNALDTEHSEHWTQQCPSWVFTQRKEPVSTLISWGAFMPGRATQ